MKFTPSVRGLFTACTILAASMIMTSCDLGDVAQRYQTESLDPIAVATFTTLDVEACGLFSDLEIGGSSGPEYVGFNVTGVGDNGTLDPGDRHAIYKMHSAIKFDLDATSIPRASANPSLAATLRFYATLTPRSELGDPCAPIDRVERASTVWDDTSNFNAALPSTPFTAAGCSSTGALHTCIVSTAVQDWIRDPGTFRNNGFVVHGPRRTFDACSQNIAPPGDRFDCVAALSNIELEIQFLPPE